MNTRQALTELGWYEGIITDEEKQFLDQNGYLVLQNVMTPEQIDAIGTRMDEILNDESERGTTIPESNEPVNSQMFYDLVNKGPMFDMTYTHPRVLAAQAHMLGWEMKLSCLNGRFVLPGEGKQGLHTDWDRLETPGVWQGCNSMWLLDSFTEENGATRFVPGSHLLGSAQASDIMDPNDKHPDEVLILAPAGSVVVFLSHVWHSGTLNRSQNRRRAFHASYRRRSQPQKHNQRENLLPETRARLSPAALYLLDA